MSSEQHKLPDVLARLAEGIERVGGLLGVEEQRRDRARLEPFMVKGQQPHRLDFGHFARGVPGLAAQFERVIPTEFWSLDGETATISCPCGEDPETQLGIPAFCATECGRAYLYDGQNVRVAFSPVGSDVPAA